jgi:hypothetical protein
MNFSKTELLFMVLVLPSLFALSLIIEGVWKLTQKSSGWLPILLGIMFLAATIFGYFVIFKQ